MHLSQLIIKSFPKGCTTRTTMWTHVVWRKPIFWNFEESSSCQRRQNEMKGGDVLDWKRLNLKIVETFQSGVFAPFRSNWLPGIATNFEEIVDCFFYQIWNWFFHFHIWGNRKSVILKYLCFFQCLIIPPILGENRIGFSYKYRILACQYMWFAICTL